MLYNLPRCSWSFFFLRAHLLRMLCCHSRFSVIPMFAFVRQTIEWIVSLFALHNHLLCSYISLLCTISIFVFSLNDEFALLTLAFTPHEPFLLSTLPAFMFSHTSHVPKFKGPIMEMALLEVYNRMGTDSRKVHREERGVHKRNGG